MAKNNKKTTKTIQIPVSTAVQLMSAQEQKRKSKKSRTRGSKQKVAVRAKHTRAQLERSFYRTHLLMPSLTGPFRQPRGGSVRTGLAFDQSIITIANDGTNNSFLVQANSAFTSIGCAQLYKASQPSVAWSIAGVTNIAVGSQFPSTTTIADINMVAADIVVYSIGTPLSVAAEIVVGQCLPISTSNTLNALEFYPGSTRMPCATVVQNPLRVSARKISPVADEFVATTSGNQDFELPFVGFSAIPTGVIMRVIITRCFEYRSTTVAGSVIPFEGVTDSHSSDLSAFQDARADIGDLSSTVSPAMPMEVSNTVSGLLGYAPEIGSAMGAAGLLFGLGRQIQQSTSGGRRMLGGADDEMLLPFAEWPRGRV